MAAHDIGEEVLVGLLDPRHPASIARIFRSHGRNWPPSAVAHYVPAMAIEGTCDERFEAVRQAFEANFVERDSMIYDQGASVAVTMEGELVVDLWGGTAATDAVAVGTVGAGHDHQRVVDDQDRVGAGLPRARREWRARPLRQGRRGVAGVRRRRQG